MAQYMLSVCHDQPYDEMDFNDPAIQEQVAKVSAFNQELQAAGAWVFGAGLAPVSTATVVRAAPNGEISMTDGPFAESKEHIGGFYIIDVPDLDAALAWARKATVACGYPIEVRPADG